MNKILRNNKIINLWQDLDKYLLINYPTVWKTNIHKALISSLILILFCYFICLLFENPIKYYTISVLTIVLYWSYNQSKNSEIALTVGQSVMNLLLYSIGAIVLILGVRYTLSDFKIESLALEKTHLINFILPITILLYLSPYLRTKLLLPSLAIHAFILEIKLFTNINILGNYVEYAYLILFLLYLIILIHSYFIKKQTFLVPFAVHSILALVILSNMYNFYFHFIDIDAEPLGMDIQYSIIGLISCIILGKIVSFPKTLGNSSI